MTINIYSTLHEGQLLEAFNMLQTKIDSLADWQLHDDLDSARGTYFTMLSFIVNGMEDPMAGKIRQGIIQQAYSINDRANIAIRLRKTPNDKYCQTLKQCSVETFNTTALQTAIATTDTQLRQLDANPPARESKEQHEREALIAQHDTLMQQMFNHTWTSSVWTTSTYNQYTDIIADTDISTADRALVISAVTMSAFELFDPQKLMLLMDAYLMSEADITGRALVGLLMLIIRYDKRLKHYPAITSRFDLYTENQQFITDCYQTLIALQYSKMTDTVSAKIANDIMPAILKSARFKKSSIIELNAELNKNGENPEWLSDPKDDSMAEEKIRQMTEMQMDGADVYLSSFRHLKGFKFFSQLHHWLSIFSYNYPEVYATRNSLKAETLNIVSTLLQTAPFCDSDKFSFISMLGSIPTNGHDIIASQIQSQFEEADMGDILERHKPRQRSMKGVIRAYIADLYRVFKLYPYHSQMFDPFNKQLNNFSPLYTQTLSPLLEHTDQLMSMAEFMMRKGLYNDALQLFLYLNPAEREADANIWQKIGFCQQKMGQTEAALDTYLKAYDLQPQSKWNIQHIAQTAFDSKNFDTALKFIDLVLEGDANNTRWLSRKAECLFAKAQYTESLPVLYQMAYIDEQSERTKEMLAWGLLMSGRTDKAEKVFTDLKTESPSVKNITALAHMQLILGNTTQATTLYRQAFDAANDEDEFNQQFWSWKDYFAHLGLDAGKMQIINDAIRLAGSYPSSHTETITQPSQTTTDDK
ncbi:MAG: tetratricopeptide repeat protein [Bacteroidaceae bacterium]|nr:tetratricopeptide repeat protein [Bacteroidaceae bacterium]